MNESPELKHLPYLDGWRGIAILLVLSGHFFKLPASRLGVEVFFVLSGLLMSKLLFEKRSPLTTFYRRRIARIFPTFYLYLATVAAVAAFSLPEFPAGQFFFNAVFLASYVPDGVRLHDLGLGPLWSLNVEEHSYVFLSIVALLIRNTRFARLALTAAAMLCIAAYAREGADGAVRSECAALPLLASAALNLWLKDVSNGTRRRLFWSSLLAIPLCIAVSRALHGSLAIDMILKPICVACVLNVLDVAPTRLRELLSATWLRWFGVCSYSLYLWHSPFDYAVRMGWIHPVAGLAAAIAVGACSFYFFEDPLRRLLRNGRRQTGALPAAPGQIAAGKP